MPARELRAGEHVLARKGERLRASVAAGLVVCVRDKASGIGGATVVLLPAELCASAEEGGFADRTETIVAASLRHGPRFHPGIETIVAASLRHGPRFHPGIETIVAASLRHGPRFHPGIEARAAGQGRPGCGFVSHNLRLGNLALEHLLTAIHKAGGRRERYEVMAFGAAACDGALAAAAAANRVFIEEYLALEGFAVRRLDLGGTHACTVQYDPATGGVAVTRPGPAETEALVRTEIHLLATADESQSAEDIELF